LAGAHLKFVRAIRKPRRYKNSPDFAWIRIGGTAHEKRTNRQSAPNSYGCSYLS
jgi:hypothetical protein